jgi:hypothetical protein
MWIFLSDSFLSIVEYRPDPSKLLVRARIRGDIERVFPGVRAVHTPVRADYAYRASIDRKAVAVAVSKQVLDIDYPNFKDSVLEDDRHDAYMGVWTTMNNYQRQRALPLRRKIRFRPL